MSNGSLVSAKGYVGDAFALALATPFVPESTVFGQFTFVPWVRSGLGGAQQAPGDDPLRASVRVRFTVSDDAATFEGVDRTCLPKEDRRLGSHEPYVKPAVLRLEYASDASVGMVNNCKTSASPNSGSSPCAGSPQPCTSVGS